MQSKLKKDDVMKRQVFFIIVTLNLMWKLQAQAPGCPHIDAYVLNGAIKLDDTVLCAPATLTLRADYLATGSTTSSYTVSSIPFNPPYPVTAGTPFSIGVDDIWSSAITLPFEFCFFGNSYNRVWVGSNGVLTFTDPGSTFCPWSFTASVPSPSLIKNAIFGIYHDINPAVGGSIKYAVLGSYPCRTFVFNYDNVPHFRCNNLKTTSQMVIYEGTNVIEVYVYNKPTCSSWNNGNAVIGIQNATGTVGYTPPGRNTGAWTASNEAWRFTPSGTPNYTIAWYANGNLLGYGPTINVTPTQSTEYIAVITYESCSFNQIIARDTFRVYFDNSTFSLFASDSTICLGETTTLTAQGFASYVWSTGQTGSSIVVSPTATTTYTVTATNQVGCTRTASIDIVVNPTPSVTASTSTPFICPGDSALLTAHGAHMYAWSTGAQTSSIKVSPNSPTTYVVTGVDTVTGCSAKDSLTINLYPVPQIDFSAQPSPSGCEDLNVSFVPTSSEPITSYFWNFGDGTTSTLALPKKVYDNPGKYTVRLDVVSNNGCKSFLEKSNYIDVYPLPQAGFYPDPPTVTMEDPTVHFIDQSIGASEYYYNFNDPRSSHPFSTDPNPYHTFSSQGTYIVYQIVTTDKGCKDTSYAKVYVDVDYSCYIPSSFTPYNEDGLNDVFRPIVRGISTEPNSYFFVIYNRWGNNVFKSTNPEEGWDGKYKGKFVEPGIYTFYLRVRMSDGIIREYSGNIHLLK